MTIFEAKLLRGIEEAGELFKNFPWEDASAYADWLAQTHYYVKHSTRLLCLAAVRFGFEQQDLHERFIEHAREEKGHEVLPLRDLKALSRDIKEFREHPNTAAFYQSQYFWIEHVHPMSFFGYILLLEGLAAKFGTMACERVTNAFGPRAASFLKVHSSEDPDHLEKAFRCVRNLTPHLEQKILDNFNLSLHLYSSVITRASSMATKPAGACVLSKSGET